MTQDFWLRLAVASLLIIGVWNLFLPGMLLEKWGDWLSDKHPFVGKPIGLCPACMASLYGSTFWFATGGDLWWWVPFVLALSGFMRLVSGNLLR